MVTTAAWAALFARNMFIQEPDQKTWIQQHVEGTARSAWLCAADKRRLQLEVRSLRQKLEHSEGIEACLLGNTPAMQALRRVILDVDGDHMHLCKHWCCSRGIGENANKQNYRESPKQ